MQNGKSYSIINDHLGTPIQGYAEDGKQVWGRELNSRGKARLLKGDADFCPFTYQGQMYDKDINLTYNRFRWYYQQEGLFVSQDPIGLAGGNPTMYGFVQDTNTWIDISGLMPGGMKGATSTVTAGEHSSSLPSKNKVHSEIRNLNELADQGKLKGQDVVISDVKGQFPGGVIKDVQVCAECRTAMFDPLIRGEAKSVTIPRKGGESIIIQRADFVAARADTKAVVAKYAGTKKYGARSNESFEALGRHVH